jgi:hypothetical protein
VRRARVLRNCLVLGLAGSAGSIGCTHNYYYGAVPVCGEPAVVSSNGTICEVPTQVAGGILAGPGAGRTTIVSGAPRPSRVVMSEPLNSEPLARGPGRFSWRRSDPESLATTKVDGALDDDSVSR